MKISFLGGANDVTGSCYLVETASGSFLVDCGFFQGERFCSKKNEQAFPFDPATLSAVFVTHAHYDHTGRLPLLVRRGYKGPIFATAPTKALSEAILHDAFNLMSEEARDCGGLRIYEKDHLTQAMAQFRGVNYRTSFSPIPNVHATFYNAGHILGSSFLSLEISEAGETTRVIFSGDIGNDDIPILPSTEPIPRADIVVCEATYGDRDHTPAGTRNNDLETFVNLIIGRGGTLLIPAFSIERTQELLYALDELVDAGRLPKRLEIYLDSPLAIQATKVYREFAHELEFDRSIKTSIDQDFFVFKGLKEALSVDASMAINNHKGPKIIIAGSGMMNGGRVMHHAKRYLGDEKAGVLLIGYQAEGTLGRSVQEGVAKVKVLGDMIPLKATVQTLDSFSAHGDRGKIARWLKPKEGNLQQIILVHGEDKAKTAFAEMLKPLFKDVSIVIPKEGETLTLPTRKTP